MFLRGILFVSVAIASSAWAASPFKSVQMSDFQVVGISIRTNNAVEATSAGLIPKQWAKFYQEGILEEIPNKVDSNIYAVYTDYESDKTGEYTFLIGAKVKAVDKLPPGLNAKTIPAGSYAVFTSEKGPVSQVVPQAWANIWSLEDSKKIHRAYEADFELYDQRALDPKNAQVDIYIGVHQ